MTARGRVVALAAVLLLGLSGLSLRRLYTERVDELLDLSRAAPDDARPGYAGPPTIACPAHSEDVDELDRALRTVVQSDAPRTIWQSDGRRGAWRHWMARRTWWRVNPTWRYRFLSDANAEAWIVDALAPSPALQTRVLAVYRAFPRPVLRADFLRYVLLYVAGGVWSDADTRPMQPIDEWVDAQTAANASVSTVLSIERDYPYRIEPDWFRRGWTAPDRGYALVQWTFLARPGSPVMRRAVINALLRAEEHGSTPYTDNDVIYTTGPRALTDAALETIACDLSPNRTFGWLDVSGLERPTTFGSVHILPLRAFSGDPGLAAADEGWRKLFRVEHFYSGAWRHRGPW